MLPTPEQIEAYRRDGFLVVEKWLDTDEVERMRERFHRCFEHEWETGIAPDEVNYDPATTPPDRTRQLCNVWKADRTLAATTLSERNAAFGAALAGLPGLRLIQDNMIWKPPSGKALLCHQDAAYLEFLEPKNMTTCWMALDDTRADTGTIFYVRGSNHWPRATQGGTFHAPDDWLGHVRDSLPPGEQLELVGEVLEAIRELKAEGMTMLIATHEMGFAREVADQVCFLHDGLILERGEPERIFTAPERPETQRFLRRLLEAGRL